MAVMDRTEKSGIKYYDLRKNITDIFFSLDSGLHFTWWCKASEKLLKIDSRNVIGKPMYDIFHSSKSTITEQICKEVLKTKKPKYFITKDIQFNGADFTLVNVYPSSDGLTILAKDISVNKNSEQSRQMSENRFQSTLDNMIEGCAILDFKWNYLYVNEVNARHSHKSRSEMNGHNIFEVAPGIEKTPFFEAFQITMNERIPQKVESDYIFPDSSVYWSDGVYNILGYEPQSIPATNDLFFKQVHPNDREFLSQELASSLNNNLPYKAEQMFQILISKQYYPKPILITLMVLLVNWMKTGFYNLLRIKLLALIL